MSQKEKFKKGQSFGGNMTLHTRVLNNQTFGVGIELMGFLNLEEMRDKKTVAFNKVIPIQDILMFGEKNIMEVVVMDFIAYYFGWLFMEYVDYSEFIGKVKKCIERAKELNEESKPKLQI